MTEKELSSEDLTSFKKELADIKADMMRKELEDIKKERMRKELEELKQERAASATAQPQKPVYVQVPARTALSLPNLIAAALMLLIAGYLIGTAYSMDVARSIDDMLTGFSLPAIGSLIVAGLALVLAVFGVALMTIARK
ncbi:MAG TPA: hypothetical protein VGJ92_00390 [Methanocella sp.]|jgi:hypothetical protein